MLEAAGCKLERNELVEALRLLEEAVAIDPADVKIQEQLGRAHFLQNRLGAGGATSGAGRVLVTRRLAASL